MDPSIPSSIRIAIVAEGSRGDVQPYIAIARTLQARGNTVRVFTHSDQTSFCGSFGISSEGVFYNASEAFGRPNFVAAMASGNALKIQKSLNELQEINLPTDLKKLWEGLDSYEPTILLVGMMSKSKAMLYSNTKTIPVLPVDLQVLLPVSDQGPVGLPTIPFGMNHLWWKLILWGAAARAKHLKSIAKESLGIDMNGKFELPIMNTLLTDIPSFPTPVCYGISTHVIPVHPEWPTTNFYPCGFFTIGSKEQEELMHKSSGNSEGNGEGNDNFGTGTDTAALTKFLSEASQPPVYMGWGSMICKSPEYMVTLALEALRHAGDVRGILLGGWAGLKEEHVPDHLKDFATQNVLFVEKAAHEWLFPQCACVVHHGGSGTTAASVRSGKPTIITPIQGDQFDFANGINGIGCGVGLPHMAKLNATDLGDAIAKCLTDEIVINKASENGAKLRAEDGCQNFCQVLDDWLVNGYASGEWLRKHQKLLGRCEEAWKAEQESSCKFMCTIS